jgi:hypothetical protein
MSGIDAPKDLINFMTPLEGPDRAVAHGYLERITAIVYLVMKENGLAEMKYNSLYHSS